MAFREAVKHQDTSSVLEFQTGTAGPAGPHIGSLPPARPPPRRSSSSERFGAASAGLDRYLAQCVEAVNEGAPRIRSDLGNSHFSAATPLLRGVSGSGCTEISLKPQARRLLWGCACASSMPSPADIALRGKNSGATLWEKQQRISSADSAERSRRRSPLPQSSKTSSAGRSSGSAKRTRKFRLESTSQQSLLLLGRAPKKGARQSATLDWCGCWRNQSRHLAEDVAVPGP